MKWRKVKKKLKREISNKKTITNDDINTHARTICGETIRGILA